MGKRRNRAEKAIIEVRERAARALDVLGDEAADLGRDARRAARKGRRRIEGAAGTAEKKLGRAWNRGRLRVRRLRKRATKEIDRVTAKLSR